MFDYILMGAGLTIGVGTVLLIVTFVIFILLTILEYIWQEFLS